MRATSIDSAPRMGGQLQAQLEAEPLESSAAAEKKMIWFRHQVVKMSILVVYSRKKLHSAVWVFVCFLFLDEISWRVRQDPGK